MSKTVPDPAACVFDLDGTLVDSLRDIAESVNSCLELLGLPVHPLDRYRYMVGEGIVTLCQRAIGEQRPDLAPRLAELTRAVYRTRVLNHTRPYPGVPELVERLRHSGVALGVLSNKPHELTCRIIRTFWPNDLFGSVYGYREERNRKPSPVYLERICAELGVPAVRTWMIGDTPTDIRTARAAGATAVAVTWGFRPRAELAEAAPDVILDQPAEVLELRNRSRR